MTADREKTIYKLPDGSRSYDPLSLRRRLLLESKNELNKWIAIFNDGVEELDRLAAEESLIVVARRAFDLKPLTEAGGVADRTVLEFLGHLLEWLSAPVSRTTQRSPEGTPCLGCPPPQSTTVPNAD